MTQQTSLGTSRFVGEKEVRQLAATFVPEAMLIVSIMAVSVHMGVLPDITEAKPTTRARD